MEAEGTEEKLSSLSLFNVTVRDITIREHRQGSRCLVREIGCPASGPRKQILHRLALQEQDKELGVEERNKLDFSQHSEHLRKRWEKSLQRLKK